MGEVEVYKPLVSPRTMDYANSGEGVSRMWNAIYNRTEELYNNSVTERQRNRVRRAFLNLERRAGIR